MISTQFPTCLFVSQLYLGSIGLHWPDEEDEAARRKQQIIEKEEEEEEEQNEV